MVYTSKSLFYIFKLLGECHCWWTSESSRTRVAKFYDQLRLIRERLESMKIGSV